MPPGGQPDAIWALEGNDTVHGNDQNDSILGGDGDDWLDGDSQDDTLRGEAGNDTLVNTSGTDLLDGGADDDSLVGGSNNDVLLGGEGNDTLVATGGLAYLSGGSGDDSLFTSGYDAQTLDGGEGNDTITPLGTGDRVVLAGDGDDVIDLRGIPNDGSAKFIDVGRGDDRIIVNDFDPSFVGTVPGSVEINGQEYTYNTSYVGQGYTIYTPQLASVIVCFVAGTRIMTDQGERAIETLRAGDLVVMAPGRGTAYRPVRWIGRRMVDLDGHPDPKIAAPIVIMPGALAEGVPFRTLRVSPEHGLMVDGRLIPAGLLVDGETIFQQPPRGRVLYFHVELDVHDVLIAEGAPTESYIDLGNRDAFENAGIIAALHADFTPRQHGGLSRVLAGPEFDQAMKVLTRHRAAMAERRRRSA